VHATYYFCSTHELRAQATDVTSLTAKLNLLIKVTNLVQIRDYRLGPDGRPRLASQTADSKGSMFGFERKAARLVLLAAFSYNGVTYIATPAERCRSEEIHARCRNRIVLPAWACSLRRCR
jgi:hypothetical protein